MIYDEFYGVKVKFEGENNFVVINLLVEDVKMCVDVKLRNIMILFGYNLNKNVMIYVGLVF